MSSEIFLNFLKRDTSIVDSVSSEFQTTRLTIDLPKYTSSPFTSQYIFEILRNRDSST